jgi:heme-degrading monooxygenase HmoA
VSVWTHGTWLVKAGREEEFVAVWRELARVTAETLDLAAPPTLVRNRDRPTEFLSFAPWPSVDEVERFRASEPFAEARRRLEDVLESVELRTLDEVARGG